MVVMEKRSNYKFSFTNPRTSIFNISELALFACPSTRSTWRNKFKYYPFKICIKLDPHTKYKTKQGNINPTAIYSPWVIYSLSLHTRENQLFHTKNTTRNKSQNERKHKISQYKHCILTIRRFNLYAIIFI